MRSTPIILDRLRHIRYDLQSVWDIDHLMPGGFISILNKEAKLNICEMLLWFGLRSEDPVLTMENTRKIMINADAVKGDGLINCFALCNQELFDSGWFHKPKPVKGAGGEPDAQQTIRGYILDLVRMAEDAGLVDVEKIWRLTPRDIEDLHKAVREKEEYLETGRNYRAGTICSMILASQNITKNGMPFSWQDFLPVGKTEPQTADQMRELVIAANAAYGGNVNG